MLGMLCLVGCANGPRRESVSHGRFEPIELRVPRSPNGLALLLSGPEEAKEPEFVEPKAYRSVKYPGPPTTQSLPSSPFKPIPIDVQKR